MPNISRKERCVLAVDPYPGGFGFALLRGPNLLLDWGTKVARRERQKTCRRLFAGLVSRYDPDVLVVEDHALLQVKSRRAARQMIRAFVQLSRRKKIVVRRVSKTAVRETFSPSGAHNKHDIAEIVCKRFPELRPLLPPPRRTTIFFRCAGARVVCGHCQKGRNHNKKTGSVTGSEV